MEGLGILVDFGSINMPRLRRVGAECGLLIDRKLKNRCQWMLAGFASLREKVSGDPIYR